MFSKLIKYLPLIIILFAAYEINTLWTEHQELLESKQGAIPAIQNRIARFKREQKEVESFMADIEAAKQRMELVAQEVEALQRKLPANISDTENIAMFQKIIEDLNIRDVNISPSGEENHGFYFKKRYEINAKGTFLQFLLLLEQIAENERLLNVRNVEMRRDNNGNSRGRYQLTQAKFEIETYRYNANHKEDRTIKIPQKETPAEEGTQPDGSTGA